MRFSIFRRRTIGLCSRVKSLSFGTNPKSPWRENFRLFSASPTPPLLPSASQTRHQEALFRRTLREHSFSILFAVCSLIAISVTMIFWKRDHLKDVFSKETADVASRSLSNRDVVEKAETISKAIVHQILTDPAVRKEAQSAAVSLSTGVVNDPEFQKWVQKRLGEITWKILQEPETSRYFVQLVLGALNNPQTLEATVNLLTEASKDPRVREYVGKLVQQVLVDDAVKQSVHQLGIEVAEIILENKEIEQNAKVFVEGIVSDKSVQIKGSTAARSILLGILNPWQGRYLSQQRKNENNEEGEEENSTGHGEGPGEEVEVAEEDASLEEGS